MPTLQHPDPVKSVIADAVVDLIDAGAGAGTLRFFTASDKLTELARLTFSDPAFGPATAGVATASAITEDANTAAGTVAWFGVYDSNSVLVFEGDVTSDDVGTGSILLSSTTLGTGDTLSVSTLTYTSPS